MKILHTVESYPPAVGGMPEVVRQLSERLVGLGHAVTVATGRHASREGTTRNGVTIAEFNVSGSLVRGLQGEVATYREFVIGGDFDIVTNFAAQQWATDALLPVLDKIPVPKVFVPTGFSYLHDARYLEYYRAMPDWLRQYDMNIFLSDRYHDVDFARSHHIDNRVLIPNGAAADEFLPAPQVDIRTELGIPREHALILHVGAHTGLKGHAEAIGIFGKSRLRHATLLLVGSDKGTGTGCIDECRRSGWHARLNPLWRITDRRLQLRVLDRAATINAFKAADLLLFPSRIECSPVVLFEALAARTPFLTTDVGNAAEIIEWSQGGVLLPTRPDEDGFRRADISGSALQLESLWYDPARRQRLGESGFAAWRERFTWERIALRYEELYRALLQGRTREGGQ
ncbi:glycosyltransferase family 4 protein [Desulfuromonas sp. TF]|uniref:glycosyltransferase family 4 protein n=1 Tax=Desulfuromonas sp. TF TaxID=1232410 RepID=UPI00040E186D|nr:glycosyltransferase family 4 protein [Desulfuromonas sp. TF]